MAIILLPVGAGIKHEKSKASKSLKEITKIMKLKKSKYSKINQYTFDYLNILQRASASSSLYFFKNLLKAFSKKMRKLDIKNLNKSKIKKS